MENQEVIDKLIDYIDKAILKNSVSNRHVAAVLAFLNEGLKNKDVNLEEFEKLFLSKEKPDIAQELITFLKGLISEGLIKALGGIDVENGILTDTLTATETVLARLLRGTNVEAIENIQGKNILASEGVGGNTVTATDTVKGNHVQATETVSGKNASISNKVTTLNLLVQALADTYDLNVSHVATLFRTIVKDYISSEQFIPGFTGNGMKLYKALNGDWNLELDNLTVRKAMTVFELIISKIRAVNGGLVISPANGKVKSVLLTNGLYRLEMEDDMMFVADDLVRCQSFSVKSGVKYYWVRITSVSGSYIFINALEFTNSLPAIGDDLVQFGNKTNKLRQGLLYLTAAEDGKPRISVLDGVNSTDLTGKTKVILGCLDDIVDSDFSADSQPSGYGLYAQNVFLKGMFILRSGKTVESELDTTNTAVKAAKSVADAAKTAAGTAQTTANTAVTNAATANTLLADLASDNKLTPTEKQATRKEWDIIVSEKPLNNASAVKFGVATTACDTAYSALNTYITPLLASLTTTSNITGTDFRAKFKAYYDARTNLLNSISAKAKSLADDAQASVDNLQVGGRNLLPNSDFSKNSLTEWAASADGNYAISIVNGELKITGKQGRTSTELNNSWNTAWYVCPYSFNEAGDYTLSFEAYALAECTLYFRANYFTYPAYGGSVQIGVTKKKYSIVFKNSNYDSSRFLGFVLSLATTLFIDNIQLEIGNKATDWTPAPEDIKSELDGLSTQITTVETRFEVREGQISAKVTEVTTKATQAATSATNAKTSETNASGSATTAGQKATAAAGSAANAKKSADDAAVVLKDVTLKESSITQTAGQIATKVTEVNTKVTEANTSATNAKKSETAAGGSAVTAGTKAGEAATSATNAKASADSASSKLTTITEKESSINQTASQISTKVTEVTKKATEASTSATNASGSASTATTKANAAAGSATTAGTKAGEAATSATNSKNSADSAAAKLTTITQKESSINQTASNITLQVTEVTTKASQASTSAANASNAAELAMAMSQGKMLYRDPTFKTGYNSVGVYNNASNGAVVFTRPTGIAGNPNGSGYCLKITTTAAASPGWGGFAWGTSAKANRILAVRFIANIPTGRSLVFATNGIGTDGSHKWLTGNVGTGSWKEYSYKIVCGSTGTFNNTAFFYLIGGATPTVSAPLVWYLAYATVYDVTDAEVDYIADAAGKYTTKTEHSSSITQLSDKIELKVAKTDFNALGNRVSNAETTITQHTGQIALKAAQSNVTALGTRVSAAELKITPDAIRTTVKSQTDSIATSAANNAVNGLQVGGRNYFVISQIGASSLGFRRTVIRVEPQESYMVCTTIPKPSATLMDCWATTGKSITEDSHINGVAPGKPVLIKSDINGDIIISFRDKDYPKIVNNAYLIWVTKGNKATDWTPAPEDVEADAQSKADSAKNAAISDSASKYTTKTTYESGITQLSNQIATKVASTTFNALGQRVSSAETTITQHTNQISLKAAQADVTALGTRMSSAEAKITPDAIKLTVKSQTDSIAAAAAKRTEVWVDATGLDASKYYPVTMVLYTAVGTYMISVDRILSTSYGKPSWSTHPEGFSVLCRWTTNASGWGGREVKRTILDYTFSFASVVPVGSIGQLVNSSQELIYVRGGSKYRVTVEGATGVSIVLRTSDYTHSSSGYSETAKVLTTVTTPVPDIRAVNTRITNVETQFEIREGQISAKVTEVTTKATQTATSATNAKTSETNAGTKATAAGNSATAAAGSATTASQKATAAANSASDAATKLATITTKETSINQTASQITIQASTVTTKTAEAVNAAELAAAMSKGRMLYRDPTFESGLNGTSSYGLVGSIAVVAITGCPNRLAKGLRIIATGWTSATDPRVGGFLFANQSRANAVFVVRIVANIPAGRNIQNYHNAYGTGGTTKWLTSQAGTGKWQEYACKVTCGASGTFSTLNHFALYGGVAPTAAAPVTWYVAYATVFDTTDVDDVPTVDEIKAGVGVAAGKLTMFGKGISLAGMVTFSSLASDAQSKVNTAQSTANTAVTNAGTAQSTANNALGRASYLYGTCDTAAATAAKVVALSGFTLFVGAMISVRFTNSNSTTAPMLNVNGTGAKAIVSGGVISVASEYTWATAYSTLSFCYDGAYWRMINDESYKKAYNAQTSANTANSSLNTLKGSLKSLAYLDTVEVAKLGTTVIEGGYLKTTLIKASSIDATKINVTSIQAAVVTAAKISALNITTKNLTVTNGAKIGNFVVEGGGLYAENTVAIIGMANSSYSTHMSAGQIVIDHPSMGNALVVNGGLCDVIFDVNNYTLRAGGVYNAPGVLWAGTINSGGGVAKYWGNGCHVRSAKHSQTGHYYIDHDLGHGDYFAVVQPIDNGKQIAHVLITRTTSEVGFRFTDLKDNWTNCEFSLFLFGRNK